MTRILLIRHGHTEILGKVLYGRTPGIHLSERGKQEASRMAVALRERYQLDGIVSSPMLRAKQTAEAIAALHGKEIVLDDGLQEIDFGEWMGKPFAELGSDERWKLYNRSRSLNGAPRGEFMMQVQFRAWMALERVLTQYGRTSETTVATITHGDVIRGLLMLFLGVPLDYIHRLEIETASVSEVLFGDRYPQVVRVNQTF